MYAELSNFIKAICHPGGHWSWALRSPGTKRGGFVSPAPIWGRWSAFLTVNTLNTDTNKNNGIKVYCFLLWHWCECKDEGNCTGWVLHVDLTPCPEWNIIISKNSSALTQFKNRSVCFQDPSKLCANQRLVFIYPESHFEYHCVGICSFLCHYREISMSSWEKGARKYMTTNCLFCGRYSEHVD